MSISFVLPSLFRCFASYRTFRISGLFPIRTRVIHECAYGIHWFETRKNDTCRSGGGRERDHPILTRVRQVCKIGRV